MDYQLPEGTNIEVARSFSRKVNMGNYSTVDFFASMKVEVTKDQADMAGKKLSNWCVQLVERDIEEYLETHPRS